MKIAVVVLNSVLHDARVKKEADSLAKAGHDVIIFGTKDNSVSGLVHATSEGVPIRLIDWQTNYFKKIRHCHIFSLFIFLALLPPLTLLFYFLANRLGLISNYIISMPHYSNEMLLTTVVVAAISVFFFYYWFTLLRKINNRLILRQNETISSNRYHPIVRALIFIAKAPKTLIFAFVSDIYNKTSKSLHMKAYRETFIIDIKKFDPDVIHCHDAPTLPIGLALKKDFNVKVVFDSHEIYEEMANMPASRSRMAVNYQKEASPELAGMITVNDHIATYLHDKYKFPKPVVVCNATLLPETPPIDDGRLHKAANLDSSIKILLYQGGFAKHRGLIPLIESASMLPDDWCIVFMGRGYFEEELKELAAEVDFNRVKIHFIPQVPQNELLQWTAGASLGIIPYENVCLNHWFCSPNKIWEYSAAGLPMLISPFPVLKETVEKHGIGWTISNPVTPESIAQKVAELSDKDLNDAREACRSFILNDNWAKYEKRLIDLYSTLAKSN